MQQTPEKPSIKAFFLRIAAGLAAGITGSLLLLVIYLLTATYIQPLINPATVGIGEESSPMFVFVFMVIVFIAILTTNIVGSFLMGMAVRERYTNLSEAITKILFMNLLIFVLMIPLYLIAANINVEFLIYAVALQIFLSAQASILCLEVVSNGKYAIIGIYSTIIAILLSAGILFLINKSTLNPTAFFFAIFPTVWVFMGLSHGLLALLYGMVASASGKDFMAIERESEQTK